MSETIAAALERALAAEYAAGWAGIYNDETRGRLGESNARINVLPMLRAIHRAGLRLVWEQTQSESSGNPPAQSG